MQEIKDAAFLKAEFSPLTLRDTTVNLAIDFRLNKRSIQVHRGNHANPTLMKRRTSTERCHYLSLRLWFHSECLQHSLCVGSCVAVAKHHFLP